jgi:NitT/TauT family transport system permease protein
MIRSLIPDNELKTSRGWHWQDALMILVIFALAILVVQTAAKFNTAYDPKLIISTEVKVLPSYTLQTLVRMTLAYFLSLIFSLVYSYTAYRSKAAASILIPILDILQSIPVLSFLPGVVLALIATFPNQRIGVEIASIILIFTGMAWNMVFSFYQSLNGIPSELIEASEVYRLNAWQRFFSLELPAGVIGLVWNSVMSWAGGWFFLMAIESFSLGNRNYHLPGLGSYLSVAAQNGDYQAITFGVIDLILVIILTDIFVWRPLIAWAEKFKFQTVEAEQVPESAILDFLQKSPTVRALSLQIHRLTDTFDQAIARKFQPVPTSPKKYGSSNSLSRFINWLFFSGVYAIVIWGIWEGFIMLSKVDPAHWKQIFWGAILTALRVFVALFLSLLWTVPVGVAIGRNQKLAKFLQPIVQIVASVPATALFPILLLGLIQVGGGLKIGAVALMMLGTMWYLLFNVIAGAQAIPSELLEAATVYKLSLVDRWKTLILPGIFPYLMTGIITAVGGAWNASIVSEYVQFQGKTLKTSGLGETISSATSSGDYPMLLAATLVMSALVVLTNRTIWRPLYKLAFDKYKLMS